MEARQVRKKIKMPEGNRATRVENKLNFDWKNEANLNTNGAKDLRDRRNLVLNRSFHFIKSDDTHQKFA